MTDDARYGLRSLRLVAGTAPRPVEIDLFASWSATPPAKSLLHDIAGRQAKWIEDRYGQPALEY